jgi:DNA polymerase (family 10)
MLESGALTGRGRSWLNALQRDDPAAALAIRRAMRDEPADLRAALRTVPRDLRRLIERGGCSLAEVAALHRLSGATTSGDLAAIVEDGWLGTLSLDEAPYGSALRRAVNGAVLRQGRRLSLGRALALADGVRAALVGATRIRTLESTGSLRRMEETVGDIHLLAAAAEPAPILDAFIRTSGASDVLHHGARQASIVLQDEQIDLRIVAPEEFGFALVHYTGSRGHNRELAEHAAARRVRLLPHGLARPDDKVVKAEGEEEAYEALGLPFIPPEIREGNGEVALALGGGLRTLVSVRDIRGDLHLHSDWSDGRDPIAAMVRMARALGYEYVAITDHSASAAASRVVTVDRLLQQAREIDRVQRQFPEIAILHGVEVEILPDGTLDFPDEVLGQLDIVLASLHDRAGHTGARLTERYLRAMRHPLVNIITHPANRIVGRRSGYDVDWAALFRAAVETGTALEVDGAPGHLDLDGPLTRRAMQAGVTLAVDSDCHRAEWLERQMTLGVGTARRGWLEQRHVLNTRALPAIREFVRLKRARGRP